MLHCLKDSIGEQGRREERHLGMEGMLQCEGLRTIGWEWCPNEVMKWTMCAIPATKRAGFIC